jgi:hypothetical protein
MRFRIVTVDIYEVDVPPEGLNETGDPQEEVSRDAVIATMRSFSDAAAWAKSWNMLAPTDEPIVRTISAVEVEGEVVDWCVTSTP